MHVANSSNAHKKQKTRWHEINNIFLDVREKIPEQSEMED